MTCLALRVLAFCAALPCLSGTAMAQSDQGAHLSIELNAADQVDAACRISFVLQNGHASDITQAVFEAVLFDKEGRVDRMTLFDFGSLPAARPRVRQFVVPDLACADLGQVLFNGAATCTVDGASNDAPAQATTACTDGLQLRSLTDTKVTG